MAGLAGFFGRGLGFGVGVATTFGLTGVFCAGTGNVRSDVRSGARLVRTGPNSWAEANWARGLCVMCDEPLKDGDVIACVTHRRQMDALEMPWDVKS